MDFIYLAMLAVYLDAMVEEQPEERLRPPSPQLLLVGRRQLVLVNAGSPLLRKNKE